MAPAPAAAPVSAPGVMGEELSEEPPREMESGEVVSEEPPWSGESGEVMLGEVVLGEVVPGDVVPGDVVPDPPPLDGVPPPLPGAAAVTTSLPWR